MLESVIEMWYSGTLQNLFIVEQVIIMLFFIEALSSFNSRIIYCKITCLEVMWHPGSVPIRIKDKGLGVAYAKLLELSLAGSG